MRVAIIFITIILYFSCSSIKKTERLADKGNASACYKVVEKYINNLDYIPERKKPEEKIIKYCTKGISLDTIKNERLVFYQLLAHYTNDRDLKYAYYKKAALLDDGEAEWRIGLYYLEGQEKEIKNDSALYWLKKATMGNNSQYAALANYELGNIYSKGKIVLKDSLLALHYYKKACACFGNYPHKPSCEKVIFYYKRNSNSKDTSELSIYEEIYRRLQVKKK